MNNDFLIICNRYMDETDSNKKHLIFYHGENCIDGAMAYAILQEALIDSGTHAKDIIAIPLSHNKPEETIARIRETIDIYPQCEVNFVDYFPNGEGTQQLYSDLLNNPHISDVHIRDHHKTALDNLNKVACSLKNETSDLSRDSYDSVFSRIISAFSEEYSATMMIWQETHPQEKVPDFVVTVGKADLNQLQTDEDYYIASYMDSIAKFTPQQAIQAYQTFKNQSKEEMVECGKPIYETLVANANTAIANARIIELPSSSDGEPVATPIIEIDKIENLGRIGTKMLKDQLCGKAESGFLLVARPITGDDRMNISVIPCGNKVINAEQVAIFMGERYKGGGGGRPDQAAFQIPNAQYEKMLTELPQISAEIESPEARIEGQSFSTVSWHISQDRTSSAR
jgi:hypothetical protein